ncbi:hypothetical protein F442_16446 [Phytophthora nicotianae P10297]|uniref:Uncharacterized protein n=1 Tax=Phytophthora nicotianae P10297 TaxID=1317064 RepID=W2YMA9_PHYNI|nr:hypothetical protein F442_16446 [Phytophthora nicotianae P10297]
MESQNVSQQSQQTWYGGRKSSSREPLRTKEERMQNHQRYLDQRGQKRPVIRTSTSRPEDMCYYCHGLGHHAYEYKLKKADMEDAGPVVNQADDEEQKDNSGSGNGQRV